jgi:hypothetical protein
VAIAVLAMRVMEVSTHQKIAVIAMWHDLVPTVGGMFVIFGVGTACMLGSALVRIGRANHQGVLIRMAIVGMIEMAIVKIVHMTVVKDCDVSAVGAMHVGFRLVSMVGARNDESRQSNRNEGPFHCFVLSLSHW